MFIKDKLVNRKKLEKNSTKHVVSPTNHHHHKVMKILVDVLFVLSMYVTLILTQWFSYLACNFVSYFHLKPLRSVLRDISPNGWICQKILILLACSHKLFPLSLWKITEWMWFRHLEERNNSEKKLFLSNTFSVFRRLSLRFIFRSEIIGYFQRSYFIGSNCFPNMYQFIPQLGMYVNDHFIHPWQAVVLHLFSS